MDFEQDMLRLEEIAQRLQSGQEGIEKSMELYAKGISLADALQKRLDAYKTQIEVLKSGDDAEGSKDGDNYE